MASKASQSHVLTDHVLWPDLKENLPTRESSGQATTDVMDSYSVTAHLTGETQGLLKQFTSHQFTENYQERGALWRISFRQLF